VSVLVDGRGHESGGLRDQCIAFFRIKHGSLRIGCAQQERWADARAVRVGGKPGRGTGLAGEARGEDVGGPAARQPSVIRRASVASICAPTGAGATDFPSSQDEVKVPSVSSTILRSDDFPRSGPVTTGTL
jgi:hypothetical protein